MRSLAALFVLASLACGGLSRQPTNILGDGSDVDSGLAPELDLCEDPTTCSIGNQCYAHGVVDVPAGDGCNTCSCNQGVKTCTTEPCNIAGASCVVGEREYPSGGLVPVDCNSCLCVDGELRSCSTRTCAGSAMRCRISRDCYPGDACVAPECGSDGVCVPYLECPVFGPEACSCGGQTHPSACVAARADIAVAHVGPCEDRPCLVAGQSRPNGSLWDAGDGCNTCSCADGTVICSSRTCVACGGALGATCEADEYCNFPDLFCGAQSPGVCALRPKGNCQIEASSACGCDGNRYSNYCAAAAAGVSIGECPDAP